MPTKARTRQTATEERAATAPEPPRTAKIDLPFVTAEFRVPQLRMPKVNRDEVVAAARALIPSPREAAYYGGLALLAAFEVLEWPVAAAIGVGTAVVGRGRHREEPEWHREGQTSVPTPRRH